MLAEAMDPENDAAASPPAPAAEVQPYAGPRGIGGWLILITIGPIATPIKLGLLLNSTFVPLFSNGAWSILTTPGSTKYHWAWKPFLLFEFFGNVAFILWAVVLLLLLFGHSRKFPKLMIAFLVVNLLFVVCDEWVGGMMPGGGDTDAVSIPQLVRSIIVCAIWVPYFLVSERVKNTFTK